MSETREKWRAKKSGRFYVPARNGKESAVYYPTRQQAAEAARKLNAVEARDRT